ncbi:myo-inosose-2 dehydratase [Methylobacterium sp. J-043]|uniref:myo-inosose-2 dehydratase n=1 Tax=Methylobacteriaceae TaxID=119045 RepID=UPI00074FA939|nr:MULTISPECIES: myo-inosose-2 dehydratase [Methylobacteriaceae]MCJ2029446.1 myo-inosose-2 dehydratase [Methylobacterium sp. J-043]MCP1551620.1 inosose dehydratase [Methylorubrum zatmanii]MDF9861184.1 inosose dehydratase [Methylorubrum pseudosasae]AMB44832.1 xylose isomerase [Methylobacterium sp. AMS5]MCP1556557.1 inosose dehydratase [Methylorubrum extorquens]
MSERIRFGVSPIAWINDDLPELGAGTPLERMFHEAAAIGYDGIELGGAFPREPAALSALLAPSGLALAAGWYASSLLTVDAEAEIEALQPHLRLLRAMGCDVFIAAECSTSIHGLRRVPLAHRPVLDWAGWRRFGRELTHLSEYLAREGFRLAYHHHLGTAVQSVTDLSAMLAHTPSHVGLVLDTGHAVLGGIDPVALIREHPERIAHVHCKDVRPPAFAAVEAAGGSFLDGVLAGMFTVPGDGSLAFGPVLRALADIKYRGWLIVEAEQDPQIADPRIYGRIGLETVRREAIGAGLTTWTGSLARAAVGAPSPRNAPSQSPAATLFPLAELALSGLA